MITGALMVMAFTLVGGLGAIIALVLAYGWIGTVERRLQALESPDQPD